MSTQNTSASTKTAASKKTTAKKATVKKATAAKPVDTKLAAERQHAEMLAGFVRSVEVDLRTLLRTVSAVFDEDERSATFACTGILRALCDNFDWNVKQKRQKAADVQAEAKDLLDPTKLDHGPEEVISTSADTPIPEILVAKLDRKLQFYDALMDQMESYEVLLEAAQILHLEVAGSDWRPRQRGQSVKPAQATLADMAKRFGIS